MIGDVFGLPWHEWLGLVGVALILLAYAGLQGGRLDPKNPAYSLLNLIGSALVLGSLYFEWNLPSAVVEGAWMLVSLYGLWQVRCHRSRPPPAE